MAVSVRIKQKSIFKKKMKLNDIISLSNLDYGVFDEYYRLMPNKIKNNVFLYDKNNLGRGFELWLEGSDICLSLNLPCSKNDIIIFYQTIEKICTKLKINNYIRDGEFVSIKDNNELIESEIHVVEDVLINEKKEIDDKSKEFFMIFAIYNPVFLGKKEFKDIDSNIDNFSNLLNEKQSIDAYYAAPHFFKNKENENIFGMYAITEDVLSIVPIEPYVPFNQNIKTDDWRVCLIYKDMKNDEKIKYSDFINNVSKKYYDNNHVLVDLSKKDIENLVEKYGKKVKKKTKNGGLKLILKKI